MYRTFEVVATYTSNKEIKVYEDGRRTADENGRISYSEIEKRCSAAEVDPCSMAHDLQSEEYEIDYGSDAAQA